MRLSNVGIVAVVVLYSFLVVTVAPGTEAQQKKQPIGSSRQPADLAGIRPGDVIVSIGNQPVLNANDLRNKVAELKPGETVPVTIIRQGKEMKLPVTMVERTPRRAAAGETAPPPAGKPNVKGTETFGIDVANLTTEIRRRANIPAEIKGIVVISVNPSVMDERLGLKPDDVIERIKVDGNDFQEIASVAQFRSIAAKVKSGDPVMLMIVRGNNRFFISFKVS